MSEPSTDVTALLRSASAGESEAQEALYDAIYRELRRMAGGLLQKERSGHTLQPTALVHEVYVRLAGHDTSWDSRAHFFGSAARAMRRILVDYARQRAASKRGGEQKRVTFHDLEIATDDSDVDLLALDEALDALAEVDPRLAHVVHLRYFAGLKIEETAQVTGTSVATVKRDWTYARAWLLERLS